MISKNAGQKTLHLMEERTNLIRYYFVNYREKKCVFNIFSGVILHKIFKYLYVETFAVKYLKSTDEYIYRITHNILVTY